MLGIEQKVARTAKRAGLLSGGLLLCAVGTGFLTIAGWLALVPMVGMQVTAAIIAAIYLGAGLICVGVSTHRTDHDSSTQPDPVAPLETKGPPVMQAFMYGLQAGSQAEQRRH